ncbi:prevent-host-death family protein [Kineosphaera limosa]|uniref:Antitoxin n=1 Tax=Kineosphaera limosa NBRC 100340 TaxID=1184609 RepID=K6WQD5_9MICO|nr:type II toxin-antitoxin system Phd/YefM family antitoxin [Kineosphaera limosa]NYE02432.1 prevent-host-death family protein [Kineosphaera limosa]GAB96041.1 putative prevent-host-death family protein [Kineosphaera limosa NBRC 100340]
MSVVSARTFNQSPSAVKAMAKEGPVIVTDRGRPTIVVMDYDEYERLSDGGGSVRDSLVIDVDVEFEPVVARDLGQVPQL